MFSMIKSIIIEDEIKSLKALETLLLPYNDTLEVTGAFSSPIDALQAIKKEPPDLVFLDIEMPKMNGFELLEQIKDIPCNVIFTTAYNQFAIQAFKYSAVGYLLKPIDIDDLKSAINKVQSTEIKKVIPLQLDILRQTLQGGISVKEQKVALPAPDGLLFIPLQNIIRCESDSNYTKVFFTNQDKIVLCRTLKEIEDILGEQHFIRVHQSHLINMSYIKQFVKSDGGYLLLDDHTQIPMTRGRRDYLMSRCTAYFSSKY